MSLMGRGESIIKRLSKIQNSYLKCHARHRNLSARRAQREERWPRTWKMGGLYPKWWDWRVLKKLKICKFTQHLLSPATLGFLGRPGALLSNGNKMWVSWEWEFHSAISLWASGDGAESSSRTRPTPGKQQGNEWVPYSTTRPWRM